MSIHGYINKHHAVSIGWPFPNFQNPRFQNEAKRKIFHVKITFICMIIIKSSLSKTSYLNSFFKKKKKKRRRYGKSKRNRQSNSVHLLKFSAGWSLSPLLFKFRFCLIWTQPWSRVIILHQKHVYMLIRFLFLRPRAFSLPFHIIREKLWPPRRILPHLQPSSSIFSAWKIGFLWSRVRQEGARKVFPLTKSQDRCSLPADVLWGSFVTHSFLPHGPWGRNECVTSEP